MSDQPTTTTTYLISGASRGLGLETARQLLAQSPQNRIIAGARAPEKADLLQDLIKKNPGRIEAVAIDVADPATIKVCRWSTSYIYSRHTDACARTVWYCRH